MSIKIFGFELLSPEEQDQRKMLRSPVPPTTDEASADVFSTGAGGSFTNYAQFGSILNNENQLINQYRNIALNPEVDGALEEIICDFVVIDEDTNVVEVEFKDGLELPPETVEMIQSEFKEVLSLLDFETKGYDIVKRWYVDGRINYHIMIDETNPNTGIQELRYIDPRKIKKIREIARDPRMPPDQFQELNAKYEEYYVYNDSSVDNNTTSNYSASMTSQPGMRISKDSIAHSNSGLFDASGKICMSFLHQAIRPANQMRMIEDAIVVYTLTRSTEKLAFYVDVDGLQKPKADQHIRDLMNKFKNKLIYNPETGDVKDDKRFVAMTENYWLPRRGGSRNTEISTVGGTGTALNGNDWLEYYRKKLYQSLHIPYGRVDNEAALLSAGPGSSEISRDEIKFAKFITRLRSRFNMLFEDLLRVQLSLKGILSTSDWEILRKHIRFKYARDNHFAEIKENELMMMRLNTLQMADPFADKWFTREEIQDKVLHQTDEEKQLADVAWEQRQEMELQQMEMEMQGKAGPVKEELIDPVTGDKVDESVVDLIQTIKARMKI